MPLLFEWPLQPQQCSHVCENHKVTYWTLDIYRFIIPGLLSYTAKDSMKIRTLSYLSDVQYLLKIKQMTAKELSGL